MERVRVVTGFMLFLLCLFYSMTSHCKPQVSRSGKNLPHQINTHHRGRKSYAKQPRAINDRCTIQNVTSLKMYWNNVGGVDVDDSYPVRSYLSVETVRKELKFDPREPTFIMIHGYMGCKNVHRISYPNRLKHAIARHFSKANIFWVDWTHRSYDAFNYLGVTNELPLIAEEIDASLRLLEKAFPPFDRTNITVFGHSLGSHVAGNLGRVMDGKLDTIIGIDPANPLYVDRDPKWKLTVDDAKFVVGIHTDIFFGSPYNLADRDFYFNGGKKQPDCGLTLCDHLEAPLMLTPYMDRCRMVAYRCETYESFRDGLCGFCGPNSDDCALAGHEWQYRNEKPTNIRPSKFDQPKTQKNVAWNEDKFGTKYHIMTSDEKSKCIFLYQVVVEFKEAPLPIWALIVTYKGKQIGWLPNNKKVLMPMNLALTRGKKLKVFTSKNSTREVSGEFVYTALFKFNAKSDFWPAMPLSFDDEKLIRVQVFGGLNREFTAYFNFMSSINYAERVKYSSLFIYPDKKKSRLYREYDYSDEYGDYY